MLGKKKSQESDRYHYKFGELKAKCVEMKLFAKIFSYDEFGKSRVETSRSDSMLGQLFKRYHERIFNKSTVFLITGKDCDTRRYL